MRKHKYNNLCAKLVKLITFNKIKCFNFRRTRYHSHKARVRSYWGDFKWGNGTRYTGGCDGSEKKK